MRVPKRNYVGGVVAKFRKVGIFRYAPGELEQMKRDQKVGRYDPALQSALGKRGGPKQSAAKTAACRKNGALSGTRRDSAMQAELGRRGAIVVSHNRWHVARGITNPNCPLCPNKSGKPNYPR